MYNGSKALSCAVVLRAIEDYKKLQKNSAISNEERLCEEKLFIEFFESINKMEWYYFLKEKYRCVNCDSFDKIKGCLNNKKC